MQMGPYPKDEPSRDEVVRRVNEVVQSRRSLRGYYSYNKILDVNLATLCLGIQKDGPIRVLEVGVGHGLGLHQLDEEVSTVADGRKFEFYGIGMNKYSDMLIRPEQFIHNGLMNWTGMPHQFDVIFSVYTFHYIGRKLEGLEKIHNQLLADNGFCVAHFPGYLVNFAGDNDHEHCIPEYVSQFTREKEIEGNNAFGSFVRQLSGPNQPNLDFRVVPHMLDDDDGTVVGDFGRISFKKERGKVLDFGATFAGITSVYYLTETPYIGSFYTKKSH